MKIKDHYNPLWIIDLKRKPKDLQNSFFSLKEQCQALKYLEAINADIQKFTNLYFKHIEKTPEMEESLSDIKNRFTMLNKWFALIKSFLKSLK